MKNLATTFGVAAVILVVFAEPAFAYIDPGTGSMILQGIIGGVAGGLFILRTYWAKIVAIFSGSRGEATNSTIDAGQAGKDA